MIDKYDLCFLWPWIGMFLFFMTTDQNIRFIIMMSQISALVIGTIGKYNNRK